MNTFEAIFSIVILQDSVIYRVKGRIITVDCKYTW